MNIEINIDQLQPGRELDALVAEKVMGYELMPSIFYGDLDKTKKYYCVVGSPASEEVNTVEFIDGEWEQYYFCPSVTMLDAWQVVEFIKTKVFSVRDRFTKNIYKLANSENQLAVNIHWSEVIFRLTPEMICKASLKAILGGESE